MNKNSVAWLVVFLSCFTWSTINPHDRFTWWLEVLPAILAREILIRKNVVHVRAWLGFIVVSICLGFSAFYEILEWTAAAFSAEAAELFLGTQGYVWDTQSDMLWAFSGALIALITLSGLHDRQIAVLDAGSN